MVDYEVRQRVRKTRKAQPTADPNFPGEHPATRQARLQADAVRSLENRIAALQREMDAAKDVLASRLLAMQKAGQEEGWATWWRMALD